jgi:hypothetical protein
MNYKTRDLFMFYDTHIETKHLIQFNNDKPLPKGSIIKNDTPVGEFLLRYKDSYMDCNRIDDSYSLPLTNNINDIDYLNSNMSILQVREKFIYYVESKLGYKIHDDIYVINPLNTAVQAGCVAIQPNNRNYSAFHLFGYIYSQWKANSSLIQSSFQKNMPSNISLFEIPPPFDYLRAIKLSRLLSDITDLKIFEY